MSAGKAETAATIGAARATMDVASDLVAEALREGRLDPRYTAHALAWVVGGLIGQVVINSGTDVQPLLERMATMMCRGAEEEIQRAALQRATPMGRA